MSAGTNKYLIIREGAGAPFDWSDSYDGAMDKARRQAIAEPEVQILVYKPIRAYESSRPVVHHEDLGMV